MWRVLFLDSPVGDRITTSQGHAYLRPGRNGAPEAFIAQAAKSQGRNRIVMG